MKLDRILVLVMSLDDCSVLVWRCLWLDGNSQLSIIPPGIFILHPSCADPSLLHSLRSRGGICQTTKTLHTCFSMYTAVFRDFAAGRLYLIPFPLHLLHPTFCVCLVTCLTLHWQARSCLIVMQSLQRNRSCRCVLVHPSSFSQSSIRPTSICVLSSERFISHHYPIFQKASRTGLKSEVNVGANLVLIGKSL